MSDDPLAERPSHPGTKPDVVKRNLSRFVAETFPDSDSKSGSRPAHPLLKLIVDSIATGDAVSIVETPVAKRLAGRASDSATGLGVLGELAADSLQSEFPFATDVLNRMFCAGPGPTIAAMQFESEIACGGQIGADSHLAGLAAELLAASLRVLTLVDNDLEPEQISFGNGITTLTADFALSRSLQAIAGLGLRETERVACSAHAASDGAALDVDDAWQIDRSPKRYFDAAGDFDGVLHAEAAASGARFAGAPQVADALGEFGFNIGTALRIANDLTALFHGDRSIGARAGDCLGNGNFTLPVIYAVERDSGLKSCLSHDRVETMRSEIVDRVRATDAFDRSVADCERFAAKARTSIETASIIDNSGPRDLAAFAVARAVSAGVTPTGRAISSDGR